MLVTYNFFQNLYSGLLINYYAEKIPTRLEVKQAGVNETRFCLAASPPVPENFKKSAERFCTLQSFVCDDL